jgi:hypothetical protein
MGLCVDGETRVREVIQQRRCLTGEIGAAVAQGEGENLSDHEGQ